jgi:hypothetical protein
MPAIDVLTPLTHLDNWFGGSPDQFMLRYQQALEALEGGNALGALASNRVEADVAVHFSSHWLSDWWPDAQPIESTLKAGIQEAVETGLETRLPLSALWIQTESNSFQTFVGLSANQVTLVILTPMAPTSISN